MKRLTLLWILTLSFVFSLHQNIFACSCGGYPSVCDAYNSAEGVFLGMVTKVVDVKNLETEWVTNLKNGKKQRIIGEGWKHYIKVEKTYKGTAQSEIVLATENNSCSSKFEVGSKLLLYAYFSKNIDAWKIGYCGRDTNVEDANEDLLFLNGLPNTLNRTLISGELSRYEDTPEKGFERTQTFANSKLTISSKTKTYNLTIDQNGIYQIYNLPIDTYKITPEIPNGLKIRFPIYYGFGGFLENILNESNSVMVDLEENRCVGVSFLFNTNNKISGKVFDANGNPMKSVCLELIPLIKNPSSYFRIFDCTEEDGSYVLDDMPAGKYRIVANEDGGISSSEPFPKLYYPNSFDEEKATVITMDEGDFRENFDIKVPSQSETITVEGKFLYFDGKPVVDEFVRFYPDSKKTGIEGESTTKTDNQGRFLVKVLKGQKGRIFGGMHTYAGEFINCPILDKFIKNKTLEFNYFAVTTPKVQINAMKHIKNVVLTFPFPSCQKAKDYQ